MPKVWTPEEGLIHSPPPVSRPRLPRRPNIRRRDVSASSTLSPTVVPRVVLVTLSMTIRQCDRFSIMPSASYDRR
jgi:hypothetical protein